MMRAGRTFGCGRPVLVLALLATLLTGCDAESRDPTTSGTEFGFIEEPFQAESGVLLARPSRQEELNATFVHLVDLIRHTPAGETIRIVGNSFSFAPVADALVAAHQRGVRVQVVIDHSVSGLWHGPSVLREALGTEVGAESFVMFTRGELHQKTWSFTRSGDSRNVVLVGSMNLTYRSAQQYTDVFAYVGRPRVRDVFDRRFDQLVRELPHVGPTPSLRVGRDQVWFYPGYSVTTDPVRTTLEALNPVGAEIRVVMYAWIEERGVGLAEVLASLAGRGADVEVVFGPSVGALPRQILAESEVRTYEGVFYDGDVVHHKLTLVSAVGDDGVRRRFVLTGSDNFTSKSLLRPEVLLRIDADRGSTWRRYREFVDAIVARARRKPGVG